ncbi:MAG: hypothetical protein HUU57_01920 [Bdellovibrio sp.]|nr:hypothetical protein [Bdellovibrio sp.]
MRRPFSTILETLLCMSPGNYFKALRLLTFLSLASAFCSPVARAAESTNSCSRVFAFEYALGGRLQIDPRAEDLAEPIETYAQIITRIDADIAPLLAPTETKIKIDTAHIFSAFDDRDFSVSVGVRPPDFQPFSKKANRNILIHEYGHAIFEKNLVANSPEYREMRKYGLALEKELLANDMLLKKLQKQNDKSAEWSTAVAENNRLKKLAEDFINLKRVRYAYHEVFADTLVWITTKNPKAIREGLENLATPAQENSVASLQMRDMDAGLDPLNMQTWKEKMEFVVFVNSDLYFPFLPVRWELWSLSKDKIHDEAYRKSLPDKVFRVLLKNFTEDLGQSPKAFDARGRIEGVIRLNDKIIHDLRQTI